MSLVHITGDINILRELPKPKTPLMGEVQGYMSKQERNLVKKKALEIIKEYKSLNQEFIYMPEEDDLLQLMEFMVNSEISNEYIGLLLEEMDLGEEDPRNISWDQITRNKIPENFKVLVIGSGMSGILAGIRLKQSGINFKIIEKNSDLGGTWYENSYPGCRVDIANHFFSFSFYPNHQWSEHFSRQPEILDYFRKCAYDFGIMDSIHFNSRVIQARYEDQTKEWVLEVEKKCTN